ncbi:hypothetical protein ACXUPC_31675, partial [Pseudomonas marginalis]
MYAKSPPGQFDWGVFVALDMVIGGGWGVVDQGDGWLTGAIGAGAFWVGDGQVDLRQLIAGVNEVSTLLGQH